MKTVRAAETAAWIGREGAAAPASAEATPDEGIQFFTGVVTGVLLSLPFWAAIAWLFLR